MRWRPKPVAAEALSEDPESHAALHAAATAHFVMVAAPTAVAPIASRSNERSWSRADARVHHASGPQRIAHAGPCPTISQRIPLEHHEIRRPAGRDAPVLF